MIYNALDPNTMRVVVRNIETDARNENSPVFVVYANLRRVSEIGDGLSDLQYLRTLHTSRTHVVLGNTAAVDCWHGRGQRWSMRMQRPRKTIRNG
jgi:hypothetical protein